MYWICIGLVKSVCIYWVEGNLYYVKRIYVFKEEYSEIVK